MITLPQICKEGDDLQTEGNIDESSGGGEDRKDLEVRTQGKYTILPYIRYLNFSPSHPSLVFYPLAFFRLKGRKTRLNVK